MKETENKQPQDIIEAGKHAALVDKMERLEIELWDARNDARRLIASENNAWNIANKTADERDRLQSIVAEISRQKLSEEIDPESMVYADAVAAYDELVLIARAALERK